MPLAAATLAQLDRVILGKAEQVRLSLACLLAGGHLLLEDVPGVGKTTLAQAIAASLGLHFSRMQFTSDLLPADLLGVSIYEPAQREFRFHEGPIFTQLLLADEINRATPKTQSALLEAMEERQVSEGGTSRALPSPFFVIATQNPASQLGTFALPESQLDRFLMTVSLGYPDPRAERELLLAGGRRDAARQLSAVLMPKALLAAQQAAAAVYVSGALADYVLALVTASRLHPDVQTGLSPRAALGLLSAARAWAWLAGRQHALPEDVRAVFGSVAAHRLLGRSSGAASPAVAAQLLATVAIP
ncbi:MoxR family ATPase [Deinococcus detaillensis]|uniref:MoxR family ATPase n=2 Tax=Deinococcus detaillensis TaxID=2592048 RepID=A0A553V6S6_9DEIO|nr:MoxR family ATPase [Deinococcus detaillensis]TSA88136.1 MoxR family ATPase [Deinococcus detaillensis]